MRRTSLVLLAAVLAGCGRGAEITQPAAAGGGTLQERAADDRWARTDTTSSHCLS